jgi:CRISPR-associated protein Cas2
MKDFLAVYDIADPKRLRRIANVMKRYGIRVQKSVFECRLQPSDFDRLCREADDELDPQRDGVRFYPLFAHAREKQMQLGIQSMAAFPNAYIA